MMGKLVRKIGGNLSLLAYDVPFGRRGL